MTRQKNHFFAKIFDELCENKMYFVKSFYVKSNNPSGGISKKNFKSIQIRGYSEISITLRRLCLITSDCVMFFTWNLAGLKYFLYSFFRKRNHVNIMSSFKDMTRQKNSFFLNFDELRENGMYLVKCFYVKSNYPSGGISKKIFQLNPNKGALGN